MARVKAAELLLDLHRFFGALIPGCIWATAIGLFIWEDSLYELFRWREWTGVVTKTELSQRANGAPSIGLVLNNRDYGCFMPQPAPKR